MEETDLQRFTQLMSDFSVDYGVTPGNATGGFTVIVRTDNAQYWYFDPNGNFYSVDTDE